MVRSIHFNKVFAIKFLSTQHSSHYQTRWLKGIYETTKIANANFQIENFYLIFRLRKYPQMHDEGENNMKMIKNQVNNLFIYFL